MTAELSTAMKIKRQNNDTFNVLKENSCQLTILHPEKMSFKEGGEIMTYSDEHKLRKHATSRHSLKEILKDLPQAAEN